MFWFVPCAFSSSNDFAHAQTPYRMSSLCRSYECMNIVWVNIGVLTGWKKFKQLRISFVLGYLRMIWKISTAISIKHQILANFNKKKNSILTACMPLRQTTFVNFSFISSNIPAATAYGVYIFQLIRYSRACGSYHDFLVRGLLHTRKLLNQGSLLVKLKSSLRVFYARNHDLVNRYRISVSQLTTDMFRLSQSGPFITNYRVCKTRGSQEPVSFTWL
jgi:hypothetical protein